MKSVFILVWLLSAVSVSTAQDRHLSSDAQEPASETITKTKIAIEKANAGRQTLLKLMSKADAGTTPLTAKDKENLKQLQLERTAALDLTRQVVSQGFRRFPGSQLRMSGAEEKTGQKPSSTPS